MLEGEFHICKSYICREFQGYSHDESIVHHLKLDKEIVNEPKTFLVARHLHRRQICTTLWRNPGKKL
jgi:hypothetical protein